MTTSPHDALRTADSAAPDAAPDAVHELVGAMESGGGVPPELFTDDAVLDATVPNWRFSRSGSGAIAAELSTWYRHPGRVEHLGLRDVADGVAVEVDLSWDDAGVPHAVHQMHLLRIVADRIASHTVWCGGRWPADLLAEMAAADAG